MRDGELPFSPRDATNILEFDPKIAKCSGGGYSVTKSVATIRTAWMF